MFCRRNSRTFIVSIFVVRYALKIQADPTKSLVYGDDFSHLTINAKEVENHPFGIREKLVLATLAAGIAVIVWGVKVKGWYFELSPLIFLQEAADLPRSVTSCFFVSKTVYLFGALGQAAQPGGDGARRCKRS